MPVVLARIGSCAAEFMRGVMVFGQHIPVRGRGRQRAQPKCCWQSPKNPQRLRKMPVLFLQQQAWGSASAAGPAACTGCLLAAVDRYSNW